MSRYATTSVLQNNDGMRRFTTSIIPVMPISLSDVYIQTTSIERLDKLANTFYNDSTLWWVIATANGLGKGTIVVPKNVKLRIPSTDNMQQIINNINNTR
jgi:hypothetical protein